MELVCGTHLLNECTSSLKLPGFEAMKSIVKGVTYGVVCISNSI